MYEAELFLKRILKQPDDDAPRLVYADWLEEQGDPRGEFIRLQCALATTGVDVSARKKLREREQSLRDVHGKAWAKPFAGIARSCTFRRGFVEGITIGATQFLEHADDLFDQAPLRRIRLANLGAADIEPLASAPALARVSELDLTANDLLDTGLERLMRTSDLWRLRWLNLSVNGLSDRSWNILAHSPSLPNLQWLDLSYNHLRNLQSASEFHNLIGLELSHNDCSIAAVLAARTPRLAQLHIAGNPLGDDASPMIIEQLLPQVASSGVLDLSNCGLATTFAGALATARNRRTIHVLNLDRNAIGDTGLMTLARATGFDQLTNLQLAANGISDRGALALIQSDLFPRLMQLDLRQNQLTRAGIDALWLNDRRRTGSTLLLGDNIPPEPLEQSLSDESIIPISTDAES